MTTLTNAPAKSIQEEAVDRLLGMHKRWHKTARLASFVIEAAIKRGEEATEADFRAALDVWEAKYEAVAA